MRIQKMILSTQQFDLLNLCDLNVNQQSFMKGGNLVQILAGSLNPSTTNECYNTLSQMKPTNNFSIDLLVISDDGNCDINIRQSALIYLKNIIEDNCKGSQFIPQQDLDILKASLLQALVRNVANRKLTPTFREIMYIMAQRYYPKEWPNIVDDCLNRIQNSPDLGGLLGAVQTLKAIYSVFGASLTRQIQLGNLCNKTILALLGLASKLFQNFNQQTSLVLVSIFKLFSTAIMTLMPEIIMMNIHNFMIFVKKILDLQIDFASNDNINLFMLKKISLRILYRIYQQHANFKMTRVREFAQKFHANYTKSFVETLIFQIMAKDQEDRVAKHRSMELVKLSLACLGLINRQNQEASMLLIQHRESILRLCFHKFRSSLSRNYSNFNEFKQYMRQNRVHLQEFVISLLNCDVVPQQQGDAINSILAILLDYLEKGDNEQRELALYMFTEISTEVRYLLDKLNDKMIILVLDYVKPLLGDENHIMIRARSCELISSYIYLDLPEENIVSVAELIYGCMMVGDSEKQTFLKIYACNAFNSIMKYSKIAEFIKPFIPKILQIYTDLLKADASIIKNFQDLIGLLEEDIAPYANDLAKMFISMFADYTQKNPQDNQNYGKEEEDDEDSGEDEADTNFQTCARACISSLRQILQTEKTKIHQDVSEQLFELIVWVFSEREQNYIEEGFNVLNLLLYKLDAFADQKYFLFFKVIVYAILGLPSKYVEQMRNRGDNYSMKFADILENVSIDPDKDLLENSIGCLRNFIAKSSGDFLRNERDELNISYMEYLFKVVNSVHESKESTQTDRLMVLTIFISLIQYEAVSESELSEITSSVQKWMQMEHDVVKSQNATNHHNMGFGNHVSRPKYTYSPVYLQILILSVYFYKCALGQMNLNIIVERVIAMQDSFKCDSELSRVIVGFSHILNNQLVGEQPLVRAMLDLLPDLVERLARIRVEGDLPENDFDMDDEAQEDKVFGDDQNTHMIGPNPSEKDMMLGGGEEEDSEDDWQQEFNKYYISPLDKVEELKYLQDVMSRLNHIYGAYMSQDKQQRLSYLLTNAPLKLGE